MMRWLSLWLGRCDLSCRRVLCLSLWALPLLAPAASWPDNPRLSGSAFLPQGLLNLQNDAANGPIALWLDKGNTLWNEAAPKAPVQTARKASPDLLAQPDKAGQPGSCASCHGAPATMKHVATQYPKLSARGDVLLSLEDQIVRCRQRSGHVDPRIEDSEVLALSALLHQEAAGQPFQLKPPPSQSELWQAHVQRGAALFTQRLGRMNLACTHCHDQNIGRQILSDVVSPANPTGFPIYRMSWQRLGSLDRRLRACYSGVQAVIPPAGSADLRDLELFLKVRAGDLPLDGPSIRR